MEKLIHEYLLNPENFSESDEDVDETLFESSDESSTDYTLDDPLFHVIKLFFNAKHRPLVNNFITIAHNYTEVEFKENFGLHPAIAENLIDMLAEWGSIPTPSEGHEKIVSEFSLLVFLSFLSDTADLSFLSKLFDISQSSILRLLTRVSAWLECLIPEVIKWPDQERAQQIQNGFKEKHGIVKCIGALGATCIPIMPPLLRKDLYTSPITQESSIILQAVVDHQGRILNIHCGEPGGLAFASVLRKSDLFASAQSNTSDLFPNESFLLADEKYPLLKWIVPPFIDNGKLRALQYEFNINHMDTCAVIEQTFGALKTRFPRLTSISVRDLDFNSSLIAACCVLHNICMDYFDLIDADDIDMYDNDSSSNVVDEKTVPQSDDKRMMIFKEIYGNVYN